MAVIVYRDRIPESTVAQVNQSLATTTDYVGLAQPSFNVVGRDQQHVIINTTESNDSYTQADKDGFTDSSIHLPVFKRKNR